MDSPDIPQPHDSLFRYTLESTENAVSLFQAHLPAGLAAELNWDRLRLESGSFVDEELRRSESDLLYSIPTLGAEATEVLIYILFEHQSTSDRWLPLRLLGYMLAIWQRHRKEDPMVGGLPLLFPLVLSQIEGGWRVSPQFADLLIWPESQREELEKYQPRFEHFLIDLAKLSKSELQGNPAVRLAQGLLKASMERDLLAWIDWAEPLLRLIPSREFLQALFLYAANAESNLDLRQFVAKIESARIPNAAEAIMSIAERIRVEGRAEGRAEGHAEGLVCGAMIGQIQALQRVLKRAESSAVSLEALDAGQLRAMIAELERELR